MSRVTLLVRPDLCIGCRSCQVACKSWNELPAEKTKNRGTHENPPDLSGYTYNRIRFIEKVGPTGVVKWLFVTQRCMQCGEPACVQVCPAGAMKRDEETGVVFFNKEECIGCQACFEACPYGIPRYDKEGKIGKCHFCFDRIQAGIEPACAKACPTGALTFGDREELIRKAKEEYRFIYGEKELGGLGVVFALREPPQEYELAWKPKVREDLVAIGEALRALHAKGIPIPKSLVKEMFA